jgi:hypothetical protein
LISKAQIRYEGMLYSVNREDATIALSKGATGPVRLTYGDF